MSELQQIKYMPLPLQRTAGSAVDGTATWQVCTHFRPCSTTGEGLTLWQCVSPYSEPLYLFLWHRYCTAATARQRAVSGDNCLSFAQSLPLSLLEAIYNLGTAILATVFILRLFGA